MRKILSLAILALAVSCAIATADAPKGDITQHQFTTSQVFPGTVRDYWLYVPKQYDPAKPACVHVNQDGIQFNAPQVFDELIAAGEVPVTIGVFVMHGRVPAADPEKALDRFNRSFEYDGLGDNYARFLLEELLPSIEGTKTADGREIHLSKSGNDRSIGGSSSGAICAFTAAWERPDAFSRVFSAIGTYVGLRGGHNYSTLIRKYEPKPLRIFLQDGTNDLNIYAGDWWMANQAMQRSLAFAGYEHEHVWDEGPHSNDGGTKVFKQAMQYLWKNWPEPVKAGAGSPQLQDVLLPGEPWKLVGEGYQFTEGTVVDAKGNMFFADVGPSKLYHAVVKGDETYAAEEVVTETGNGSGFTFLPDGRMASVAGGRQAVEVFKLGEDFKPQAKPEVLTSGIGGNDIAVRHDGTLYVTGPVWNDSGPSKIYMISPKGEMTVVDEGIPRPNGIVLSPDQTLLYVADSASPWVYSFQIKSDGTLAAKQKYFYLHMPDAARDSANDGMEVDSNGRLYVTNLLGVQICDQPGRVNCIVPVPSGVASNVVLGGPDFNIMLVTSRDKVYARKIKPHGVLSLNAPVKPGQPGL